MDGMFPNIPPMPPPGRCAHSPPATANATTNINTALFDKPINTYLRFLIGREATRLPPGARESQIYYSNATLVLPINAREKETWKTV
jgi:hypothetical protein